MCFFAKWAFWGVIVFLPVSPNVHHLGFGLLHSSSSIRASAKALEALAWLVA
jgi:hypothetical protein